MKGWIYYGLMLFFVVFVAGSGWGQTGLTLEEVLAPLEFTRQLEVGNIGQPEAAKRSVVNALRFEHGNLPEAENLVTVMFLQANTPDNLPVADKLQQMKAKAMSEIQSAGYGSKEEIADLEKQLSSLAEVNEDEETLTATFDQRQVLIGAAVGRYLLEYFYKNPDRTSSDAWRAYISQLPVSQPAESPVSEPEPSNLQDKLRSLQFKNGVALAGLLALSVFTVFLFFRKNKRSVKTLSQESSASKIMELKNLQDRLQHQIAGLENQVQNLQQQLEELKEVQPPESDPSSGMAAEPEAAEIERSEAAINEITEEEATVTPDPEAIVAPVSEVEEAAVQTFFSVAPKNNFFYGRQLASEFQPREHIYRITVVDETTAYYYLVDDEVTRRHAYNIPDNYLKPGMELKGSGRISDADDVQIERGTLVREGNNWKISSKAVLTYS